VRSFWSWRPVALVVIVLGVLAAVALPARAAGHAQLIRTAPASGATLTTAPDAVQLEFSGNVISLGLQFQVIGPGGLATEGKPVVDFTKVTQPLAGGLVNGSYQVNWHVVHDDGHPDTGSFGFVVQVPGGATATGSPVAVAPIDTSTPQPQGLPVFWVVLGVVVVVLLVAVAVIIDRRRRSEAMGP